MTSPLFLLLLLRFFFVREGREELLSLLYGDTSIIGRRWWIRIYL